MQKITITTREQKQVIDLTKILNDLFMKNNYPEGLAFLFLHHTSCAITVADMDTDTDKDYLDAFAEIVPKLNYRHPHDPGHVGDHILSAAIGTSLTIPVQSANMILGVNQKVVLFEFNGPKERRITVSFIPLSDQMI